jgi:hypothetical protein
VLAAGTVFAATTGSITMFPGIRARLSMKLTKSRTFGNGKVLLCYETIA